jgi:diguanylate cyclase (GGDEF)-like protein
MSSPRPSQPRPRPEPHSLGDLQEWVRQNLPLSPAHEAALRQAIDSVFRQQERQAQESKRDVIQAMSAGFAERMHQMREDLASREATVVNLTRHFEKLVADLTDRVHRDPKTRLMNFRRFIDELEAFLSLDQRNGRWCAVGLVDITAFKSFNDRFGHTVGDRVIERVARLLREQIRADDLVAQDPQETGLGRELHARFGGDEFCFLIPGLEDFTAAYIIAERFRSAVDRFEWAIEDPRLGEATVAVDVGVVGLYLGPAEERRGIARQLSQDLLSRADKAMYEAKSAHPGSVRCVPARVRDARLVDLGPDEPPVRGVAL